MDERLFWLGFSLCNGIGPAKFRSLLAHFGTAKDAWLAPEDSLLKSGIGKDATAKIQKHRNELSIERYYERMQRLGVDYLILNDIEYPKFLQQIEKPPFVLYVKGNKSLLTDDAAEKRIAVVGTRKITEYGKQVTEAITKELASSDVMIVSGLALGVDAVAHTACLDVAGKTIAVLGSGVDVCTPGENQNIYERILLNGGTIVSEVPPGYLPNKGSFPSRNRIIAGLCEGVLVTEGAADSGSLITAALATKAGRKVFAVPGPITSSVSRGTNVLITQGATVVTSAKDVLDKLSIKGIKSIKSIKGIKGDSLQEQKIIDLLLDQNLHFDELVRKTGFESSQVGTLLSLLEMKGIVVSYEQGVYGLLVS